MSKVLLLDVDGVVLHQPRVMKHVAQKIATYVHTYAPHMHSIEDAMALNRLLYTSYSHTHRGLKAVYGHQIPPLDHFNSTIYDVTTLNYLWHHRADAELKARANAVRAVVAHAKDNGIPTYLFTNSPGIWCQNVVEITNLADLISPACQLSASHPVFKDTLLKPDQKLYENVATFLHYDSPGWSEIVFVDDSWGNLRPIIGSLNWYPLYFSPDGPEVQSPRVGTIRTMTDVFRHLP